MICKGNLYRRIEHCTCHRRGLQATSTKLFFCFRDMCKTLLAEEKKSSTVCRHVDRRKLSCTDCAGSMSGHY